MPFKIRWSETAISRLTDLADFLDEKSPESARAMVVRVLEGISILEDHPHAGRIWFSTEDGEIRRLVIDAYLVFYEILKEEGIIQIHTMKHGRERPLEPDEVP